MTSEDTSKISPSIERHARLRNPIPRSCSTPALGGVNRCVIDLHDSSYIRECRFRTRMRMAAGQHDEIYLESLAWRAQSCSRDCCAFVVDLSLLWLARTAVVIRRAD